MRHEQRRWSKKGGWTLVSDKLDAPAHLVFIFGETEWVCDPERMTEVWKLYPGAHFFGCSTAGEIQGDHVWDDSIVVTAIHFERTQIRAADVDLKREPDCFVSGAKLGQLIPHDQLKHVFVLSVGLQVNGSELVRGLSSALPAGVGITGGLAGDQARFQDTVVISGETLSHTGASIVGLYGEHISIGMASLGGWDPFGPERLVTRSQGNILYELDGKSALQLYKTYLGDHAKDLPGSALLFPLCLKSTQSPSGLVRTILGVNENEQSMTFAGDVPEQSYVRFMKANFDRLIEGAVVAAKRSVESIRTGDAELALLISCVGRKIVLGQRIEEEIEGVRDILGPKTVFTGFYSYGEISPFTPQAVCELHNQTMTITTLSERDE